MSDLITVFSSGMSHLVDFAIASSVSFVAICLALRGIEYTKSFIRLSGPEDARQFLCDRGLPSDGWLRDAMSLELDDSEDFDIPY